MAEVLEVVGKVAGLAGLCVALVLFIFKDLIRKLIFPTLPPAYAYRTIRLFIFATSIVAVIGMALYMTPIIIAGNGNLVVR